MRVTRGTAYVPVMNVSITDSLLYPHTIVGSLEEVCVVSLPAGITEVPPQIATVSSHLASPSVQDQLESMDLSSLPLEAQTKVKSLQLDAAVFSSQEGDVGCTNLIAHEIPLLDDAPVWQRYKRIPPSEDEEVKQHINQLLEAQII